MKNFTNLNFKMNGGENYDVKFLDFDILPNGFMDDNNQKINVVFSGLTIIDYLIPETFDEKFSQEQINNW